MAGKISSHGLLCGYKISNILVKPKVLRATAMELVLRAIRISSALTAVDCIMQQLDITQFEGKRASSLLTRYRNSRDTVLRWPGILEHFSNDLQATANLFERVDRSQ